MKSQTSGKVECDFKEIFVFYNHYIINDYVFFSKDNNKTEHIQY